MGQDGKGCKCRKQVLNTVIPRPWSGMSITPSPAALIPYSGLLDTHTYLGQVEVKIDKPESHYNAVKKYYP